ncbi:hypothetical protein EB796_000836 [Bugula neritina]|uniref:Uncharacterized protein n=1 Tax=Bugula neritina TaxID=10212 RepID=A0A7J7KRY9_BUGNE|nr:hypothetical protein EB796_000836 [Bugula neritina]
MENANLPVLIRKVTKNKKNSILAKPSPKQALRPTSIILLLLKQNNNYVILTKSHMMKQIQVLVEHIVVQ